MKFFSILAALYASAAVMALPLSGAGSEVELLEKRMPDLEELKNHVKATGKGIKGFVDKKQPGDSRKYNAKDAYGKERDQLRDKKMKKEQKKAEEHKTKEEKAKSNRQKKKQAKKAGEHETEAKKIKHEKWDQ